MLIFITHSFIYKNKKLKLKNSIHIHKYFRKTYESTILIDFFNEAGGIYQLIIVKPNRATHKNEKIVYTEGKLLLYLLQPCLCIAFQRI